MRNLAHVHFINQFQAGRRRVSKNKYFIYEADHHYFMRALSSFGVPQHGENGQAKSPCEATLLCAIITISLHQ